MSRKKAVLYCYKENDRESVMISVSDPRMAYVEFPFCSKANKIREILQLEFSDADAPGTDVYGNQASSDDLYNDEMADRVVDFVMNNQDADIIVHCDAGISRSAGIAAAILKATEGNDDRIFDSGWYCPNMLCYRTTLNAFQRRM